jgi:rhomboid protease GluP
MIESLDKKNMLTMKLLHYLITCENYNPIILQGADNEIWLENLNNDYKVVRIVSNHIINDEQLDYDIFKTKRIVRKIKQKTFSMNMKVLSFYIDLDEDIKLENKKNLDMVSITDESDLKNYKFVLDNFPDMDKKLEFSEEGLQLFMKITQDINKKNKSEGAKVEEVFKPKRPYITIGLIVINVLIFILTVIGGESVYANFAVNGRMIIKYHEFYRIITGAFLHADIIHLAVNMYSLFVIGSQIESFQGKTKFSITYFYSLITASMLSMLLNSGSSVGASGAIFGLMGAMLAFGYYYRVYLGGVMKSQIIPIILINLLIGFTSGGAIDNYGHIGGLIGGALITYGLGVKYKSSTFERVNGIIVSIIFVVVMAVMAFTLVKF